MLLLASLAGCAVGGDTASERPAASSEGPAAPEQGQPARVASPPAEGEGDGASQPDSPPTAPTSPGGSAGDAGSASTSTPGERVLVTIDDPTGDAGAGAGAPAHGDLGRTIVRDDGSHARVTIEMAGTVPAHLRSGETVGIGVDLFHGPGLESDYQLFLDGGEAGWTAYLQGPGGFVDFPGTFSIDGRVLEVRVPWSSLGGRTASRLSIFADTSRTTTPVNEAWTDTSPATGTVELRP